MKLPIFIMNFCKPDLLLYGSSGQAMNKVPDETTIFYFRQFLSTISGLKHKDAFFLLSKLTIEYLERAIINHVDLSRSIRNSIKKQLFIKIRQLSLPQV